MSQAGQRSPTHNAPLMERKVALHRWATLAYALLLLCDSPTLSMAFCVHHSRYLRSARSNALHVSFRGSALEAAATTSTALPRRIGMRRGRGTSMLHSDTYGRSTSTPSQVQLSQLPTAFLFSQLVRFALFSFFLFCFWGGGRSQAYDFSLNMLKMSTVFRLNHRRH